MVATHLSNRLGKQFVVDNRAGAGGVVGTELVANAPKDGHTLLVVSLAITVNPWLYNLPYDHDQSVGAGRARGHRAERDLGPSGPAVQVGRRISSRRPRSSRASCNTRSAGVGTFLHLGPELFKLMAGVDILHVPSKGAAPAMIDVIGGHTQMAFGSIPSTIDASALRQAPRARRRRRQAQHDAAGRADGRRNPDCPATRPPTGSASSRPPERRPPSSKSSTRRSR